MEQELSANSETGDQGGLFWAHSRHLSDINLSGL